MRSSDESETRTAAARVGMRSGAIASARGRDRGCRASRADRGKEYGKKGPFHQEVFAGVRRFVSCSACSRFPGDISRWSVPGWEGAGIKGPSIKVSYNIGCFPDSTTTAKLRRGNCPTLSKTEENLKTGRRVDKCQINKGGLDTTTASFADNPFKGNG